MKLHKHFTANDIKLERYDFNRELSMEAYLLDNEGILTFDDDVFSGVSILQEELWLAGGGGKDGRNGRIDLLVQYHSGHIGIVELKLGELNKDHLEQLEGYVKAKDNILEIDSVKNKIKTDTTEEPKWIGLLVGTSIDTDLAKKITTGYKTEDGDVEIAALTINRFRGEDNSIYVTTDTYFKATSSARDMTKYKFSNQTYGKGRLVLAVLKAHVLNKPDISYQQLEKDFPISTQGSQGVFTTLDNAREIIARQASSNARHFIKPEERVLLDDGVTIVVSNQWGVGNIEKFTKKAEELGYQIEKAK